MLSQSVKARQITVFPTLSKKPTLPRLFLKEKPALWLFLSALLCGLLSIPISKGPQPIQDALENRRSADSPPYESVVIRAPAAISQQQHLQATAQINALWNGPVLDLTGRFSDLPQAITWKNGESDAAHQIIRSTWGGAARSLTMTTDSILNRYVDAIEGDIDPGTFDLRGSITPSGLHLSHLAELTPADFQFDRVIIAPTRDWTTRLYTNGNGSHDFSDLVGHFLSQKAPRSVPPSFLVAGLTALLILLSAPASRRWARWPFYGAAIGLLLIFGELSPWNLPVLAICTASAIGILAQAGLQDHQLQTESIETQVNALPAHEIPLPAQTWKRLCTTATQSGGALAAWVMVQNGDEWSEVARAGDAAPFDPKQVNRLRAPLSSRQPEDRAFLALPVPEPSSPIALLILQPKDGHQGDPLLDLGGAMALAAVQIRHQKSSQTTLRLLGLTTRLKAYSGRQADGSICALYDALGQPLTGMSEMQRQLGPKFVPSDSLFINWERLSSGVVPCPPELSSSATLLVMNGKKIRLETGVHGGTVECYILRVVNADIQREKHTC